MYNWSKGITKWQVGNTLYISVPFTWLVKEAEQMAYLHICKHNARVQIGGSGLMKPTELEGFEPILYHNPSATYTTRGCPNRCSFCAVHKLEPEFIELKNFRPAPLICDNNLLAASFKHIERVVDASKVYRFVDFNQGLEAKRFTPGIADLLGKLKCRIRFAFDGWHQEAVVKDAIDLCRERTTKDIRIYCLIGYKDTPESAKARLELIRSWGIRPTPMRYQPIDAEHKNHYVEKGWTQGELLKMMHYYSRLVWYEAIPYDEFERTDYGEENQRLPGL